MTPPTAPAIIAQARRLGLELKADGELLKVYGRHVPADFAAMLKKHKGAIMEWLSHTPRGWQSIPPANLPLMDTEPHPSTEDRERILAYIRRQIGADTLGSLARWVNAREDRYYIAHKAWDCSAHAYAAARDAATWQLNRNEHDALELIASCNEEEPQKKL